MLGHFVKKSLFLSAAALLTLASATSPLLAASPSSDTPVPQSRKELNLTLTECLRAALMQPDLLRQHVLATDQASQGVKLAKSGFLTIRSTVQIQGSSDDRVLTTSSDGTLISREKARIGLQVSMPLYDGGKRNANVNIAEDRVRGVAEAIEAGQLTTLQDATAAFYAVLSRQRFLDVGQLQLQAAQNTLTAAQVRLTLGAVTRGDVLTAQSAVSRAEAEQQSRTLGLDTTRSRLALLIGQDPLRVAPVAVEPPASSLPTETVEQLLIRLIASSPERAQLLTDQDAAAQEIRAVRAERTPQVILSGSGGFLAGRSSRLYAAVNLELSMPILNEPALDAREQVAKDAGELRTIALRQFDRVAREQVLSATLTYRSAQQRIIPSQVAIATAEEAYRLAQGRYQAGKGIQQEVLQALIVLAQSRDGLAVAQDERDAAGESLDRITGGASPAAYLLPLPTSITSPEPITSPTLTSPTAAK